MEFQNSHPEGFSPWPTKTRVLQALVISYTQTSLHPSPHCMFSQSFNHGQTSCAELQCALSLESNITCIPASSSSGSHKAGSGHVRQVFPPPSLLILCSLTLHKWTNVFVCCFMRSHILIPSEHCHSLSLLVLYFEVLHSSPTASPGQHSCTRPGLYRAEKSSTLVKVRQEMSAL